MADNSASNRPDSRGLGKTLGRYSIRDYIVVNIFVWAILAVLGLITYFAIDRAPVVPFLMFVVGGGFTIVSIYDCIFDRLSKPSNEQDEAAP